MAPLFVFAELGFAQRGNRNFGAAFDPPVSNPRYTGEFTFARLKYTVGPGGYCYRNEPACEAYQLGVNYIICGLTH